MKIFIFIIVIIIIGISVLNIISKIIGYHDLTSYDYGSVVGNLLLLLMSLKCLFIIQKKKI